MTILILALSMVSFPCVADEIDTDESTDIVIYGLSDANVRLIVCQYFSQRDSLLNGSSSTIGVSTEPIINDEFLHKDALEQAGVTNCNSIVTIESVSCGEITAEVVAKEIVTFQSGKNIIQKTVTHQLVVFMHEDGHLIVHSDGYYEELSGFSSASYVNAAGQAEIDAGGSPLCIIAVASNEIGYAEGSNNYTKYGVWYDNYYNTSCFANSPWCAMFVCWCANQASVSSSVIPVTASAPLMRDFYNSYGRYYYSSAYSGSYTPSAGDIIFMYDTPTSPDHVGIIVGVSGGNVIYIDGNNSSGAVRRSTISLTNTGIVGCGKVVYPYSSHQYVSTWSFDSLAHWKACSSCSFGKGSKATHSMVVESATGTSYCSVCNYGLFDTAQRSNPEYELFLMRE